MLKKIEKFITKYKYIFIGILLLLILSTIIICVKNNTFNNKVIVTNYDKISKKMDNKDTFIISYYNSKSSNKYNKKVKKYLNKNNINYYIYDDSKVDKNTYNKFLKLVNIDADLFTLPSIIYIKDGKVYSNLIGINNTNTLDKYIKDYDLVLIK